MSCYLNVKLKRKGQNAIEAPCILYLTTTPARELADEVSLVYGGEGLYDPDSKDEYAYYEILSIDTLHEIQTYYSDNINSNQKFLDKNLKNMQDYKELLAKSTTDVSFEKINDLYIESQNTIEEIKEEIDELKYYYHDFLKLEDILNDNKEYELVYYLG